MTTVDRRTFLRVLGSGALAAAAPGSIDRALAIPANNRRGTIEDIEHIVILTQENRAFDHYFGALRGVRGYGDPRPIVLPSGRPVWYQPDGSGYLLPFHPTAPDLGLQFLEDTPHGWTDTHAAWNGGKYDQWIANKGRTTMAYLTRRDIPFHYALADAFTICDAYYCSFMGPTDPNRYHMWTGWVGNDGRGGGPVINNAEEGYDWSTYPERLERAGISWKIYQDIGVGLDAAGFWGWTNDPSRAAFAGTGDAARPRAALRAACQRESGDRQRRLPDRVRQHGAGRRLLSGAFRHQRRWAPDVHGGGRTIAGRLVAGGPRRSRLIRSFGVRTERVPAALPG